MSGRRKNRAKSMFVDKDDMIFEDDSNTDMNELFAKVQPPRETSNVRSSARSRKHKIVYDPSDQVPLIKKKKEAQETAKRLQTAPAPKSPSKKTPVKAKPEIKAIPDVKRSKSVLDVKKKLPMTEIPVPEQTNNEQSVNAKKPLRRIEDIELKITKKPESEQTSDFDDVSTVELNQIPDVSKWSPQDVYKYFVRHNFDARDAEKFIEQEIDGQALLIMQRDDLKNLSFKVGIFLKMWLHISKFQTRSDDISQTWH